MKKGNVYTYKVGRGLYINLTNRCTNRCSFCIRNNGDGVYGSDPLWLEHEPSAAEVLASVGKQDSAQYDEFVFCGYGEPTMRLETLVEVGSALKAQYGKPVRLNTNGQANLIYKKNVAPLLTGAVDIVSISMNAATAEKYEAVCRPAFGRETYAGILEFARCCVPCVEKVVFTVVETTLPDEDIELCRRTAESLGASFRVRPLDTGTETR
ncbi:MAG TPA: TatD family nuclease-associated radical SAM protein [Firmicutes bacterium]|nr:TatD family nuclease-associated radical SAM protein [Bacillota bacterium]